MNTVILMRQWLDYVINWDSKKLRFQRAQGRVAASDKNARKFKANTYNYIE